MKIDTHVGGLNEAGHASRESEERGYDGLWAAEVSHDPFLPLAIAAEHTTRVDLGTSIAVAFARSPMTLASTANDLHAFSKGRLHLGLGSQVKAHITRRFDMPWSSPAARMREFVLAMRAIWTSWSDGTPLAFEGEFYKHTLMTPYFVPEPHPYGQPKVLIAGVGEIMTRVAGEVADGYLCHAFTTPKYLREKTVPALLEGRRRAGLTMDGFEVVGPAFIATGADDAEIEQAVAGLRGQISFYASTPAYRGVLEVHGWSDLGERLTEMSKQGKWAEMATLIDDDVLDAFAIVATPEELPARIADRFGDLVTRMSFTPPASLDAGRARSLLEGIRAI